MTRNGKKIAYIYAFFSIWNPETFAEVQKDMSRTNNVVAEGESLVPDGLLDNHVDVDICYGSEGHTKGE